MLPLKHTVITCIAVDDVKESFTGEITCPQKKRINQTRTIKRYIIFSLLVLVFVLKILKLLILVNTIQYVERY